MSTTGRVVALFVFLLSVNLTCVAQTSSSNPQASRKTVEPIILRTTVVNKSGELVSGLERDTFQVSIDRQPVDIVHFREEDAPISVGIILDASSSVGDPFSNKHTSTFLQTLQLALEVFLDHSNQANEYFLIAFNTKPQLLLDWTSDRQALLNSVAAVWPKGITALYDASYLAIDKVQRGRYGKHVLILITDGQDNNSTYSFKQVRDALKESDVLLYSVSLSAKSEAGSAMAIEGLGILKELSSVSGGRSFYEKEGVRLNPVTVFEKIAEELEHQYTLAIMPKISPADTEWHKIKIKMNSSTDGRIKGLSARTREGFYLRD